MPRPENGLPDEVFVHVEKEANGLEFLVVEKTVGDGLTEGAEPRVEGRYRLVQRLVASSKVEVRPYGQLANPRKPRKKSRK